MEADNSSSGAKSQPNAHHDTVTAEDGDSPIDNAVKLQPQTDKTSDVEAASSCEASKSNRSLGELAAEKDVRPAVTEKELLQYFAEYFAPNKDFYSVPGSEKYTAYSAR